MAQTQTHCKEGHEFTNENTYIVPKTGRRVCKTCRRSKFAEYPFGGNREKAIQRDGEKCIRCGITREQHRIRYGKDITVDHIDKMGVSVAKHLKNNELSNLQTLCLRHHVMKDNALGKLTDIQVINIRHIGKTISTTKIAKMYGVTQQHICDVLNGLSRTELRIVPEVKMYVPEGKQL